MNSSDEQAAGRLFIVGTPIGNLEDITLRALRILREADGVLAEDTRHSRKLLDAHGIQQNLRAFHAHTSPRVTAKVVDDLLGGRRLALITDAGMPLISDPGAVLVAAARDAGVAVEVIPGPSAVSAAVAIAGLRVDEGFRFVGFPPRTPGKQRRLFSSLRDDPSALVFFESPRRIHKTLEGLAAAFGATRPAAVCRELTKLHEEVIRGPLGELPEQLDAQPRGEITLVVEGCLRGRREPDEDELKAHLQALIDRGMSRRDAASQAAEALSVRPRQAYQLALDMQRSDAAASDTGSRED